MSRVTNAAIRKVADFGRSARLSPSKRLPKFAAGAFKSIIDASAAGHFQESDRPLLEELAIAMALARRAAKQLERQGLLIHGKASPLVRILREQQRLIGTLMTRLRITPQSRISRERAATNAAAPAARNDVDVLLALEESRNGH